MNFKSIHPTIGDPLQVPNEFPNNNQKEGIWWRHSVAGGIAGALSRTCTAPIDRIKVYMQVQTKKTSIFDSVTYLIQEGGIRSMWRGNGVNVIKISSDSALKFTIYEKVKYIIKNVRNSTSEEMNIGERFTAGAIAGCISQSCVYPFDVLKTRLALRKSHEYRSFIYAARKIYLTEGLRSFYNGYAINLLGIIPYAGIDLAVYETLKRYFVDKGEAEKPSSLILLLCGSTSSALGQIITYPCSLVRTRIQATVVTKGQPRTGLARRPASRKPSYEIFKGIIANEGILGLYRGLFLNLAKVVPAVCISYIIYEYLIQSLGVTMS